MQTNYCKCCGEILKENAGYCHHCGKKIITRDHRTYDFHYQTHHSNVSRRLPLCCILAYIPALFWIPLVIDPDNNIHKNCASQGLWLTILSVLFGGGLITLGISLMSMNVFNLIGIDRLFKEWTVFNWKQRIPAALFCQSILPFILFVPVNSICGFFHGMGSNKPYRIPFFGRFKLI